MDYLGEVPKPYHVLELVREVVKANGDVCILHNVVEGGEATINLAARRKLIVVTKRNGAYSVCRATAQGLTLYRAHADDDDQLKAYKLTVPMSTRNKKNKNK